MAAGTVSNDRAELVGAHANAAGRLLAARFARRLTPVTAGMNLIEEELAQLDEAERIGFMTMIEAMLREVARTTDVQAMAERLNARYLSTVAARAVEDRVPSPSRRRPHVPMR
jgi:hypothetical protein